MTPGPNNRAANSLSSPHQTRNIRSVEVNSRVAMMVWAIECVANLNIILIDFFNADGLITFSIIIVWYYVIIPYTFLMNTSYNKNLIAEQGWKTVLLNPFVIVHSCFSNPTSFELEPRLVKVANEANKDVTAERDKTIKPSKAKPISKVSHNNRNSNINNDNRVFIISNKKLDKSEMKVDSNLEVEDLDDIPSTSRNKNNSDSQSQLKKLRAKSSSSDSEPENYTKSYRLKIGESILNNMVKHTNDENSYLHYFYQLVEFENMLKNEPLDQRNEFEIMPPPNFNKRNVSKIKRSTTEIHHSKEIQRRKTSDSFENKHIARDRQISSLNVNSDVIFYREIRTQLRCDTLNNFERYCEDENKYDDFLIRLIEVEEELKEGGERK